MREGFGPSGAVPIRVETVASGLEVPWGVGFLPGGDLLVTERPGRVRLVHGGEVLPPIATVDLGERRGEGGLLGLALDPAFEKSRAFFLYLTVSTGGGHSNRVERWRLADDRRSAERERVILDGIPGAEFHDGGRLRFAPDGMLWIGTGDARRPDLAQSSSSLAGKLLRVTASGEVPPDNPTPGSPIALLGIRNVQAFDWRADGTVILADHGPSGELGRTGHDEIDVAHIGQNLGWPVIYGCEDRAGMVTPSLTWEDAVPPGGAALYTGTRIAEWRGSLLVGVLGAKHLHRVVFDPASPRRVVTHEVYLGGDPPAGYGRLREVIMGPDGDLYVTTSNCDGRGTCPPERDKILRITR